MSARPGRVRGPLADDQALVRTGFRMILKAEPDIEVVGEAADGAQAVAATRRLRPDVAVMDVPDRRPGQQRRHLGTDVGPRRDYC